MPMLNFQRDLVYLSGLAAGWFVSARGLRRRRGVPVGTGCFGTGDGLDRRVCFRPPADVYPGAKERQKPPQPMW